MKERTLTKGPVVTSHLNFNSRTIVLTVGKNNIGISNKIQDEKIRKRLKNLITPYINQEYGFIIRTNASILEDEIIIEELNSLVNRYNKVKQVSKYRTSYQLIEKAPSTFLSLIRDYYTNNLEEIIVDDSLVYSEVENFLNTVNINNEVKLKLYQDTNLSLFDLYGLKTKINNALKSKVWLKSGGSIIINPTEALIVIDVNTGKYTGKKNFEDTIYKINLEASKEIAKQIRLRNLAGIIIVDFIDMKNNERKKNLLQEFELHLSKDPIKTTIVDMTKLNLVEITRKKVKKPIYEQFGNICPKCSGNRYVFESV